MAAKKKSSPQSSNASEKKASAKKASTKQAATNTFTYKGKTVTGKKVAPTAAVTSPGKKATGLAQRPAAQRGNSLRSEPKVKVKNAESGFAGSGTPLGASLAVSRPGAARNIVGAALTASMAPGKGRIVSAVAKRYGAVADEAAFGAFGKGLAKSTGAGGRVSKTMTPFGPTLRSTAIGTKAQQASRIENLLSGVDRKAVSVGRSTASAIAKDLSRAGKVGRGLAAGALVAKTTKSNRKNKK